jgi:hypothetical protein
MNRNEHLAWCKERALGYCDAGDVNQAWASFVSDMRKHEETANHDGLMLGAQLLFGGFHDRPAEMRRFIEGFN